MSCAEHARAAALPLSGTATRAERWLLVEVRGAWGRDAVSDADLPADVRERLESFEGRVLLIRRPGARADVAVVAAVSSEEGGTLTRLELERVDDLAGADIDAGTPVGEPLVLVCTHGRRDACCARLGVPTYEALAGLLPGDALWQSSHQGGHRFAANVLVLPWGVQLGRVGPDEAGSVAEAVSDGRIPLDLYRGRTLYGPAVQAAEIVVRRELGLDRVADLRLTGVDDRIVRFSTPRGGAAAVVEEQEGPALPPSCGVEPEPTTVWAARIESLA